MCAPPDEEFAALLARVGVTLIPLGPSTRSVAAGLRAPSADAAFRLAAELVAARFETLPAAAEGCDALVATGLMPAGARSVAEKLGIRYVLACFHIFGLPSRHFAPAARPGRQSPDGETDNRVLWAQDAERVNALYAEPLNRHRAAIGLPPVDNVRDHVITDRPWLAADPVLAPWKDLTDLDIVQTGAWILPDERPLPNELEAFLDAGEPPVYVGFGSMAMRDLEGPRPGGDRGDPRTWSPRHPQPRLGRPRADRRPGRLPHRRRRQPPGAVPARGRRRAPRRRGHDDDRRAGWRPAGAWCPRSSTSRTGRAGWPSSASARHTTVQFRPRTPSRARSGRPWPPRPAHARPPWPPRSAPTERRWPRSTCWSRDEADPREHRTRDLSGFCNRPSRLATPSGLEESRLITDVRMWPTDCPTAAPRSSGRFAPMSRP